MRKKKKGQAFGLGTNCFSCGTLTMRSQFHEGKWYCNSCCKSQVIMRVSTFPFETTNLNGQRIEVQSLRHLRRLERQFRTTCVAYDMDEKNFKEPPQQDPMVQRLDNPENMKSIRQGTEEAIRALRG